MERGVMVQKQVRDNAQELQAFMSDMKAWETDMKRKEAELLAEEEREDKERPGVRSRPKKAKAKPEPEPKPERITSSDYSAWDKFDAEKACEEVEGRSEVEEAQYEKERGNSLVKLQKWDEAIACYDRAVRLCPTEAAFYANRALCHLKKESLHAAEADCTAALRLDPAYAKALLRRSSAREGLGSLRRAADDLHTLLRLEPRNEALKRRLAALVQRMGTKGPNSKCSTPSEEAPPAPFPLHTSPPPPPPPPPTKPIEKPVENCIDKPVENSTTKPIEKPVEKPPHARSKKAMTRIKATEFPKGATVESLLESPSEPKRVTFQETKPDVRDRLRSEKEKFVAEKGEKERREKSKETPQKLAVPKTSVQFVSDWRSLKGRDEQRSSYLRAIPPRELPSIFKNSLESDVLSEMLSVVAEGADFLGDDETSTSSYLDAISGVKRFSALAMFLSQHDKQAVAKILQRCKEKGEITEEQVKQLRNKFEI